MSEEQAAELAQELIGEPFITKSQFETVNLPIPLAGRHRINELFKDIARADEIVKTVETLKSEYKELTGRDLL